MPSLSSVRERETPEITQVSGLSSWETGWSLLSEGKEKEFGFGYARLPGGLRLDYSGLEIKRKRSGLKIKAGGSSIYRDYPGDRTE